MSLTTVAAQQFVAEGRRLSDRGRRGLTGTTGSPLRVRGVDQAKWRRLRAAAALRGRNVGDVLNEAIDLWLSREAT